MLARMYGPPARFCSTLRWIRRASSGRMQDADLGGQQVEAEGAVLAKYLRDTGPEG